MGNPHICYRRAIVGLPSFILLIPIQKNYCTGNRINSIKIFDKKWIKGLELKDNISHPHQPSAATHGGRPMVAPTSGRGKYPSYGTPGCASPTKQHND
jgi:hypothetical protein